MTSAFSRLLAGRRTAVLFATVSTGALTTGYLLNHQNVRAESHERRKLFPPSADYPDLRKHNNCMADCLTPAIYAKLRDKMTPNGYTLDQCIQTGVDNPGHPFIKTVGMVAGDEESYEVFAEIFDPVIKVRHNGYDPYVMKHHTDLDASKITQGQFDEHYVLSSRVRTGRSIRGLSLPPACSRAERREVENVVVTALAGLKGDLAGKYYSLTNMSEKDQQQLIDFQSQTDYKEAIPLITSHLESLTEKLDQYFPSLSSEIYDYVRNPFVEFSQHLLSLQEQQLTELQCDRTLKIKCSEMPLDVFWISIRREYPVISAKAVNILLQFSTSYLCEQAFSCLTNIKSKESNHLLSEEGLLVCLSKIQPRIQHLCKKKQAQVSKCCVDVPKLPNAMGIQAEIESSFEKKNELVPVSPLLTCAGMARDWPDARGIWHNHDKTFLIWINEEDHTRVISMEKSGNMKRVFERFCRGLKEVEKLIKERGWEFMWNERLGYVLTCPSNLGTGLRAGVHVKLPKLSKDPRFSKILENLRLQKRGTGGVDTAAVADVYDISNLDRMGRSEVELVQIVIDGVNYLIDCEKKLEKGQDIKVPPPLPQFGKK
nr:creatine kinase S-type, mitochondrial [Pelodiscus sinensis]|eukprot:XP_006124427.1 creatine kinase S-type, mitochondrial [Pelodiscus sinensis]